MSFGSIPFYIENVIENHTRTVETKGRSEQSDEDTKVVCGESDNTVICLNHEKTHQDIRKSCEDVADPHKFHIGHQITVRVFCSRQIGWFSMTHELALL